VIILSHGFLGAQKKRAAGKGALATRLRFDVVLAVAISDEMAPTSSDTGQIRFPSDWSHRRLHGGVGRIVEVFHIKESGLIPEPSLVPPCFESAKGLADLVLLAQSGCKIPHTPLKDSQLSFDPGILRRRFLEEVTQFGPPSLASRTVSGLPRHMHLLDCL
jgi:hypothetical protein